MPKNIFPARDMKGSPFVSIHNTIRFASIWIDWNVYDIAIDNGSDGNKDSNSSRSCTVDSR